MKYTLKKDIVIPAGTEFECCDGMTKRLISGNYETTIGLSKDSAGSLIYGIDPNDAACMEWFEAQHGS